MAKDLKKGPAKKGKKVTLGKQKLKGKNTLIHGKGKKATLKFNIDCAHPVEDGIMNCGDFEKYLLKWQCMEIDCEFIKSLAPLCGRLSSSHPSSQRRNLFFT